MITIEEYQSVQEWRSALAFFLNSDAGLAALRVLRAHCRAYDVTPGLDVVASVRKLADCGGFNRALDMLEMMAQPPLAPAADVGESGFGVEPEATDHLASQYDPAKDAALQQRRAEQLAQAAARETPDGATNG